MYTTKLEAVSQTLSFSVQRGERTLSPLFLLIFLAWENLVMSNLIKNNKLNSSGQALVEFAIILPLLLLLVFGITEFGRFLYLKNSATNAAREGARLGAVSSPWNAAAETNVINKAKSVMSIDPAKIVVTPTKGPILGQEAVKVDIKVSFKPVISTLPEHGWFTNTFSFANLTSIHASATMRYE